MHASSNCVSVETLNNSIYLRMTSLLPSDNILMLDSD